MATTITIDGKTTSIPGVYASIKSGIDIPSTPASYGNVCIIDIGLGAGFVGGAGINGSQTSGVDSIYTLSSPESYKSFVRGGNYYNLADLLFRPDKNDRTILGAPKVFFVKAASTSPATNTIIALSAQTILFRTKDEGSGCNSVVTNGVLTGGFAYKMFASTVNTGKYYLTFYFGTYKGTDALPQAFVDNTTTATAFPITGLPIDGVTLAQSVPQTLFTTEDFGSMAELTSILSNSSDFGTLFSYSITPTPSSIAITNAEFTAITGYQLFVGGAEVYSSAAFDTVLSLIGGLDNTFFLAPHSAENSLSTYNTRLLYHINNDARFEKWMYVGGGNDKSKFKGTTNASYETAVAYNSDKVIVFHGSYKENNSISRTPLLRNSFYAAVKAMGRIAGLVPYNSPTYKEITIDGLIHNLSVAEQEIAIKGGVLYFINDPELGFCIAHDSNTLQKNTYLINANASSYSITEKRILAQVSKLVVTEAKKEFYGREQGSNRFNTSPESVVAWLGKFLSKLKVSEGKDNYLIAYRNLSASQDQDNLFATFNSVPNGPINKIIFTNIILSA